MLKKVYSDNILANVQNYYNVLKLNGIQSAIVNELLNVSIGGMGCTPELWVSEHDLERAFEIIENTDAESTEFEGTQVCPNCNEEVEGQFSECWNCGTPRVKCA